MHPFGCQLNGFNSSSVKRALNGQWTHNMKFIVALFLSSAFVLAEPNNKLFYSIPHYGYPYIYAASRMAPAMTPAKPSYLWSVAEPLVNPEPAELNTTDLSLLWGLYSRTFMRHLYHQEEKRRRNLPRLTGSWPPRSKWLDALFTTGL